jgi:hypothetical protein
VDGPANVNRKITILGTLAHLLAQNAKGAIYAQELFELSEFLASYDELKNYY